MLEYVRYAGGVRWICLETNTEDIVLVVSRYMQIICTRLVVLEVQRRQLKLWDMLRPLEGKSMELCSCLWEALEVGYGGVGSCRRSL